MDLIQASNTDHVYPISVWEPERAVNLHQTSLSTTPMLGDPSSTLSHSYLLCKYIHKHKHGSPSAVKPQALSLLTRGYFSNIG